MERLRRFLLSLSLIFASTALYAQTEISGTVLDDFGEGVIGATEMEKGTSNGTVTDFEGNFKIKVKVKESEFLLMEIKRIPKMK